MKVRYSLMTALAALLVIPAAWAQAAATTDAPSKVAVISVQEAVAGTAQGKQASEQIRTQFAPRQNELQALAKQIQDLQQRLQTGANTLSDEEKARLNRTGSELQRRYQREAQDLQDDMQDASQDAINTIGQKLIPIVNRYAQQNGYGVVIDTDTSAQSSPVVIYSAAQVDITKTVIKLYDDANPVKAATPPAAHPGTTKPSQKK
ncbi:MAG TPA: OmpH family outer membrane protein [Candidatus Acidoferrales bacterium]|nr:OmpH family outer membrane protein [Candidatus Acidoferrales bacterium]